MGYVCLFEAKAWQFAWQMCLQIYNHIHYYHNITIYRYSLLIYIYR